MTRNESRVHRGGGWIDDAQYARVAYRSNYPPGSRNLILGFRLVRELTLAERLAETLQKKGESHD